MKKTASTLVFILFLLQLEAQMEFKTIVPQLPVIAGESFQVQYVIEDGEKATNIKPPAFSHFRFVTGPNIYMGAVSTINGVKPLKNIVYTLEAGKPGRFIIPGAMITLNGKLFRSNDANVEVITREEAIKRARKESNLAGSDYFLRPGENVYEKIRQNLFVKVMVDKKTCYVGEPVLATFKLYSRLESKSDIVKNPGFYGFTVYDMINLGDRLVTVENINGKAFDVHTIRKVQLYPLQAGLFTIDAMEVGNKVEFSRSVVNKKTEQEIIEGVLGNNDSDEPEEGTEIVETDIKTEPVSIRVNPLPVKNKPPGFSGATGNFIISSFTGKDQLAKNEEGFLEIKISGKGNFIQVTAPLLRWPEGMEGFEPEVKDVFDKTTSPLTGSRIFRYAFVSSRPGLYTIPAVSFSFFNPDSGGYKTIATAPLRVSVSPEKKIVSAIPGKTGGKKDNRQIYYWLGVAMVLLFAATGWLFWRNRGSNHPIAKEGPVATTLSVEEILAPVYLQLEEDDKRFYSSLQQSVWKFFNYHFNLSGSEMKKQELLSKLKSRGIGEPVIAELEELLQDCETGLFTNAIHNKDKHAVLAQAKQLLEKINKLLL